MYRNFLHLNAIKPEPKNKPVPGTEGAKEAEFSRSVNPIPTEGGQIMPPQY